MSRAVPVFKSFAFKVTMIIIVALSFSSALSNFLIHRFDALKEYGQMERDLNSLAASYGLLFDADVVLRIPLARESVTTTEYTRIAAIVRQLEELNPKISSVYIVIPSQALGEWQYIVPPAGGLYPGDTYAMPDSSRRKTGQPERAVLSGYGPIRDKEGQPVAYVGIDVQRGLLSKKEGGSSGRLILFVSLIILVSLFFSLFVSRGVIHPIKKLIEGTRLVAAGNFNYKVKVKGNDEIAELGRSFNDMALNLSQSRRALNEYFFRVVQSLITSLEAKDSYTRGHSDRVSEYAVEIASIMGFPEARVELLRRAAQLHDIGKIGMSESVLNKNGKPTDEEWKLIREHPAKGEEILEPVFLDKEMLAAVRWHHERYDGKGYPDGKSGESMNIFAQIIAVADTYDAMTSARSYRPALPGEEAVKRLKEASGSQFNPQVVETFLKILEEKPRPS